MIAYNVFPFSVRQERIDQCTGQKLHRRLKYTYMAMDGEN
jgi:hypothetical protein